MPKKKVKKETKAKKTKKPTPKSKKTKGKGKKKKEKGNENSGGDSGIIVIEDDLTVDKDAALEERKAYLEEARSQEAFD